MHLFAAFSSTSIMSLYLLFATSVICGADNSISQWLTYPLEELQTPSIQSIVDDAVTSLSTKGMFHIESFLSSTGLSFLQKKMESVVNTKNRKWRTKNVFQDLGDLHNFNSSSHPRNVESTYSIGFVGRNGLTEDFRALYQYEPLLSFLREIVVNAHHLNNDSLDCGTYSDLQLSAAEDGSVYAYIAEDGDSGTWHFDQHPFSCVWSLFKAEQGGDLKYQFIPPQRRGESSGYWESKLGYDWDKLGRIIVENEEEAFHRLSPNEGDLYCFKGNVTVHMVDPVHGQRMRVSLVTAFADYPEFKHIAEIDRSNDWSVKKEEL